MLQGRSAKPDVDETERRAVRIVHALKRRKAWTDEVISAIDLANEIDCAPLGNHETRRRCIRASVKRARERLREVGAGEVLIATGHGYALSSDSAAINRWLEDRRRAGLTDLAEVHRTKRSDAMHKVRGQGALFSTGAIHD